MKELLTYVAQNLVEHSEAVSVTESHTDGETVLDENGEPVYEQRNLYLSQTLQEAIAELGCTTASPSP